MFACQDLSLDVLVKVLKTIPTITTWKIEGRKKGPHYVYYTVQGYRLLRDHGQDAQRKKEALALLAYALGREGTHYNFLPQRPQRAVPTGGPTGSGLLIGRIRGSRQNPYLVPREALMAGDVLRIGYEDDAWHQVRRLTQAIPAHGKLHLKTTSAQTPVKGTPVFLVDRREKHLETLLDELERELEESSGTHQRGGFQVRWPRCTTSRPPVSILRVARTLEPKGGTDLTGVWLAPPDGREPSPKSSARVWWWLPPVVWPEFEQETIDQLEHLQRIGARNFVLNAPWQIAWFAKAGQRNLWAGPFCNIANVLAIKVLADLGFKGVIVSPELSRKDYLAMPRQSPLPLGLVISGNWPLCVSRTLAQEMALDTPFISPKGEQGWVRRYGPDFWVYPNWQIDLRSEHKALTAAGYTLFVDLQEPLPQGVKMKPRRGLWNWQVGLS
jgi:putative protease